MLPESVVKSSAYAYQVLADRGFGKLKEIHQVEHGPYHHASDEELEAQIQELQEKFIADLVSKGYQITRPPQLLPPPDDDSKPKLKKKTPRRGLQGVTKLVPPLELFSRL